MTASPQHDIAPISVHAPYLVNLAGPDPALTDKSVVVLAHELRVARAYGAAFVNAHVGSHRGEGVEAGVSRLAAGLLQVRELAGDEWRDVELVLENGSGGGFGLGGTIEELALIETATTAAGIER